MRTNKLRRWVLRGALIAGFGAAAFGSAAGAHSATGADLRADYQWNSVPADQENAPAGEEIVALEEDFQWN